MAKGGRRWAREEEMRAVLARWERSGLALSRFAEREGIARKTLYRWRKRTGVGGERLLPGRPRKTGENRSAMATEFAEVSAGQLRRASSTGVIFEVVMIEGTTVRVPDHFDPGALRVLIQTLREC